MERKQRPILVVEDDATIVDLLKQLLGTRIVVASNSISMFEQLDKNIDNLPSLILLNMYLGSEALGQNALDMLKSSEVYKDIPVVIFTSARLNPEKEQELRGLGVSDFIYQPFKVNHFLTKIEELTNDKRNTYHV